MTAGDAGRLVALAAIWGASFLFVRIAAPAVGPFATADLRMLIAAAALAAWFTVTRFDVQWRRHARHYVIVGILNSAGPFLLFAYAALSITAGLMAVVNATSPMWGALFSAVLLRDRLTLRAMAGLATGIAGVALVTRPDSGGGAALAVMAALGAAACYGLAGVYMRRWASHVPARGMALGTQIPGALALLPFAAASTPLAWPGMQVAASLLVLGLVCSGIAYLLYFRLVADIGATGALTVTYLVPVFGVAWGAMFLGEAVSTSMLAGTGLIVLGTFLVLRK